MCIDKVFVFFILWSFGTVAFWIQFKHMFHFSFALENRLNATELTNFDCLVTNIINFVKHFLKYTTYTQK